MASNNNLDKSTSYITFQTLTFKSNSHGYTADSLKN